MAKARKPATLPRPTCFGVLGVLFVSACGGRSLPGAPNVAAASAPPPAIPLAPEPTVELPRSPIGGLARALVEAVNVGKFDAHREFVRTHFSAQALEAAPVDEWARFLQSMSAESGGIDVVKISPAPPQNQIFFDVRSRRGRHYANVKIAANAAADRIDDLFAGVIPDAAALRAGALEPRPVAEAEAARAISQRVEQRAAVDLFSGTVLVVKGDRVLVSKAVGQADKAFGVSNRDDTKFNLGSMNKMFTAVAIGQLVERGKMAFTDSLARVLPAYPDRAFAERVTVHQLLTHTSGIGGNIFAPQFQERRQHFRRPGDYLPLLAKEKPKFPPGERFEYANPGFVVLGAVIEHVSGEDYFDYVQKHIFAPAKMRDTASFEIDESVPNCAVGYVAPDDDPFGLKPRRTNTTSLGFKGTPAGGGFSTPPDLRAFAAALRGHALLGAAMTETVTSAKVETPWGDGIRYGYGFMVRSVNGKEVRGHDGAAPGMNSDLRIFWDGSYTVAVLSNYSPPAASDLSREIVDFLAAQRGP
jgi:CubicO group peptidase (beta-lactamase class C family)